MAVRQIYVRIIYECNTITYGQTADCVDGCHKQTREKRRSIFEDQEVDE